MKDHKQWGEMPKDEKKDIVYSFYMEKENLQFSWHGRDWKNTLSPSWSHVLFYRTAPKKPEINWDHVSDKYNYLAMDRNKDAFLYDSMPVIETPNPNWRHHGSSFVGVKVLKSYIPGTCDWKESIVTRPGFEVDQ